MKPLARMLTRTMLTRTIVAAVCICTTAGIASAGMAPDAAPPNSTLPPTYEAVVRTIHDAKAHAEPDASSALAFEVADGTKLAWITEQKTDNGFYRVIRLDKGPQGWISADDVKVVNRHQQGLSEPTKACVAKLDDCPTRGCAEQGTPEAVTNEFKRTIPTGALRATLSLGDFAELQRAADARVRQGPRDLNMPQRKLLTDFPVKGDSVSEGDRVRAIGYIAKDGQGLHANKTGESVNCLLKSVNDNDFHIPLVEHANDTEFQGIVVEMIPQDRAPSWTIDALKEIQAKQTLVWIEGGLSYDNVHYVNADSKHSLKDEPNRMSLWEIHPITKFLVCRKEHCDPDQENEWSALDDAAKNAGT
jgi:hypothetical protein